MKRSIILLLFSITFCTSNAQQPDTIANTSNAQTPDTIAKAKPARKQVYKLNLAVDIPVTAAGTAWSLYAFPHIYGKEKSTVKQVLELDKNDIPKFDRWAAGMSNEKADQASDYLFYGSIPYAFTLLLDKNIRKDAGKIGFLYLEAMSITGIFYTGTVYFVDRYRPEAYDTDIPVSERQSGNMKDAFLAGHPALVATSTFFTASVFSSYHPGSPWNYAAYGVAIAATGTTAYLRHLAGKHFPSDLLCGITVGTLSGLLVPKFHRINPDKEQRLGLAPFGDGKINGVTARYTF